MIEPSGVKIAVIGLCDIGLPLAVAFARECPVAEPTPVDQMKWSDLGPLLQDSDTVAGMISEGDEGIYERTIFPCSTEEICVPRIEAAKAIENTQRDLSIALVTELVAVFNRTGTNTLDDFEATGTKWDFPPGLVGRDCGNPDHLTFLEDVPDLRNTCAYGASVDVIAPLEGPEEAARALRIDLVSSHSGSYEAFALPMPHPQTNEAGRAGNLPSLSGPRLTMDFKGVPPRASGVMCV